MDGWMNGMRWGVKVLTTSRTRDGGALISMVLDIIFSFCLR